MEKGIPVLSTATKVTGNRTTYEPMQMSDKTVYDMALHNFTIREIADHFHVTQHTVISHHGAAFDAGKHEAKIKPRIALRRIINAFDALTDNDLLHKDVPVERLLKAIELHAKKHENLGQKTEEPSTRKPLSPADIKFSPLSMDNFDKPWKQE